MDPAVILKQAAKTKNPDVRQKLFSLYKKQKLIRDIKTCTDCQLHHTRKNAVPWSGPAPAPIAVLGEGPGMLEDEQGKPFVGPAGQLLNELLKEIGLDRNEVFVFNAVCCRPPGNRVPLPDELAACKKNMQAQLDISEARLVVLLGATALSAFVSSAFVNSWHGKWFIIGNRVFFSTYHPAAALRSSDHLKNVREDFKVLKELARPWSLSEVNCIVNEAFSYIYGTCPEQLNPVAMPTLWRLLDKELETAYECRNIYLLSLVLKKYKSMANALVKYNNVLIQEKWPEIVETTVKLCESAKLLTMCNEERCNKRKEAKNNMSCKG